MEPNHFPNKIFTNIADVLISLDLNPFSLMVPNFRGEKRHIAGLKSIYSFI